jgi:hypothetical protein
MIFSHVNTDITTMKLLKPPIVTAFMAAFFAWAGLTAISAMVQVIKGAEPLLSWLGLALSTLPPLTYFIRVFVFGLSRAARPSLVYSILIGLGLAITMAMSWRFGDAAGAVHIYAGATLLMWLAYLRWFRQTS